MKLDAQQAVDILIRFVSVRTPEIKEAIAALDGKHVYASRFRPGDEVFIISQERDYLSDDDWRGDWWAPTESAHVQRIIVGQIRHDEPRITIDAGDSIERSWTESDCFHSRAEAEAAAETRNRKENER